MIDIADLPGPEQYEGSYWTVQAVLAVSPKHPKWSGIMAWALEGYRDIPETPHRMRYKFGQFWTDVFAWDDEAVAREQFDMLLSFGQKRPLRLVKCTVSSKYELMS
jgi:hypothetical protein